MCNVYRSCCQNILLPVLKIKYIIDSSADLTLPRMGYENSSTSTECEDSRIEISFWRIAPYRLSIGKFYKNERRKGQICLNFDRSLRL